MEAGSDTNHGADAAPTVATKCSTGSEECVATAEVEDMLDVVIVGAGLSGLTAAYSLKQSGIQNVALVEANDRIGGRSHSVEMKTSLGRKRFDVGGQWVGSSQKSILKLAKALDCRVTKQYTDGLKVLTFPDGKISTYQSSIPPVPALGLVKLQLLLNKVTKMVAQVPAEDPMQCKYAAEWDSISVDGFLHQNNVKYGNKTLRYLFKNAIRAVFGAETSSMSLLWFLHTCRTGGGFLQLVETVENAAQESILQDCSHGVCEKLAAEIGDNRIHLSEPVASIDQSLSTGVLVTCNSGKELRCRRVIVTAPPHLQGRIAFTPLLPSCRAFFSMYHTVGHLLKFIVTYQTAFWRDAGLSGEIVALTRPVVGDETEDEESQDARTTGHDKGVTANESTLGVVFDNCKEDELGLHPALVGLVGGCQAGHQSQMKEEDLKSQILADLARCLGEKATEPLDFVIKDWYKERWVGGCPSAFSSPGALTEYSKLSNKPLGRVHWAGTETSNVWKGYLDGAVASGYRVADEIINKHQEERTAMTAAHGQDDNKTV